MSIFIRALILLLALANVSCTSNPSKPQQIVIESAGDFYSKLTSLQEQIALNPSNAELKLGYRRLQTRAIRYYADMGKKSFDERDYQGAVALYRDGLKIDPNNAAFKDRLSRAETYHRAAPLLEQAKLSISEDNYKKASGLLGSILKFAPNHDEAGDVLRKLKQQTKVNIYRGPKIDLVFDKIDFPSALKFMSESYGFNIVLDSSVKDTPVSLNVKQIPFYEALSLLLTTTRHSYQVIPPNTLLIYADSKNLRDQYESPQVKTFYLNAIDAKEMSGILRGALDIKKVTVNALNNSVTLRESDAVMKAAESVIERNDVLKGEVAFDVEIMEVNLSNSLLTGVDYGAYQISTQTESLPVVGSIRDSIKQNTTLSIPSITLNAFKQDVDAKILSNPKVRVMDGEKAKIHIGERVPLRSSDILDATGQTRTTFEYQEIGIKLSVEPTIHNTDQVTVKLSLEVSSLGENLGTAEQQAFKIGTRNAETVMMIRDGETAILGGLIKDEDRSSLSGVPGMRDIPGLGYLFKNDDNSGSSSNILLTITPRVIRGANRVYSDAPRIASFSRLSGLSKLRIKPEKSPKQVAHDKVNLVVKKGSAAQSLDSNPIDESAVEETSISSGKLKFSKSTYFGDQGGTITASIVGSLPDSASFISMEVVFNQSIVSFTQSNGVGPKVKESNANRTDAENVVKVEADLNVEPSGGSTVPLIGVVFDAKRKGTSYLVLRNVVIKDEQGAKLDIETENAKIKIR